MRRRASIVVTVAAVAGVVIVLFGHRLTPVHGQARQEVQFAAVPAEKGGQDIFGAYEIVPNWPKPISSLPGHEKGPLGSLSPRCSAGLRPVLKQSSNH